MSVSVLTLHFLKCIPYFGVIPHIIMGKRKSVDASANKSKKATKKAKVEDKEESSSTEKPAKLTKKNGSTSSTKAPKLTKKASKPSIPDLSTLDFSSEAKNSDGKKWNLKLSSWNINGIRAWHEKNGHSYITAELPDIFALQETKCDESKIPDEVKNVDGYHSYWSSADKDGYAGTGLYSKTKPINVTYGIGSEDLDNEGRVITAEYEKFYFVTAYVPNAGRGLVRLEYRQNDWDPAFKDYLVKLDNTKPVIACGDLNVAHLDIDLKNPKTNKKTAGFTPEEREGFSTLLEAGFTDSYRELYPEETDCYTFWSYMMNARGKNVGWRLDYFLLSNKLKPSICDNIIRRDVMGSDHCPITLLLNM